MKNTKNVIVLAALIIGMLGFGLVKVSHAEPRRLHLLKGSHRSVCDNALGNSARCFAKIITDKSGSPASVSLPAGYGPAQFHGAYQIPTTSANPTTIAIVVAYDDPNITSDLATYNTTYGLPKFPTCSATVTTACFMKVDQNGGSSFPQRSSGWALETSLDIETAHQTCQNCKLILVEARNSSYSNLMQAVDRARILGAKVISNSYGSSEFNGEAVYDTHFNYPGIAFVYSSGDNGYGPSYPAASPLVTAVGGTSLNVTTSNAWQSESVWTGSGSGCSKYETKPAFQTDNDCLGRTIADIAADADPNTGAAVYDSFGYSGYRGWFQVGGTSLAAPLVAGIFGLTNNVGATIFANSLPYSSFIYGVNLHDVTTGTNGSCGSSYLCQAANGYDGPSGLGSPIGLGAF